MAQSLTKIYIHLIYHIKTTSPKILEKDLERVHTYINELINVCGCTALKVGGTENHIHTVFLLSKDEPLSHVVEEIKRKSSRWIKNIDPWYKDFAWQSGYGAFSVSQSTVDKTIAYIEKQREHHKKRTFKEEYEEFLKLYEVEYNEEYFIRD